MANDKKTGINDVLTTLFYEEGCVSITEKSLVSLGEDKKNKIIELVSTQKSNLEKAFELYKQLSPLLENISFVGEEIRKNTNNFINVRVDENNTEMVVDTQSSVVDNKPTIVAVETPEMVTTDVNTEQVVENDVVVTPEETPVVNNVEPIVTEQPVVENQEVNVENASSDFVLSPIDDGIVTAETPVVSSGPTEVNNEVAVQDVEANVVSSNEKYTRSSQNQVKAILVTRTQYDKLINSRVSQKEKLSGNINGESTSATADEQVSTPSVTNEQLQTMIEQANTLYKEGKTQEAQELFNKISDLNKQVQPNNVGGVELVKK